jgi:hypothetical protein
MFVREGAKLVVADVLELHRNRFGHLAVLPPSRRYRPCERACCR